MRKMKTLLTILSIFIVFFASTITTSAESVNEIQSQIDAINAEKAEKIAELEQSERTVEETNKQIDEVKASQTEIQNQVLASQAQIEALNAEIEYTEALIPIYTEKSNAILMVLQKNAHNNFLLEDLFSEDSTPGESTRKAVVAAELTEESVNIVNETIRLENELEAQKEELIRQEQALAVQQAELESQEAYLAVLLEDAESNLDDAQDDIMSQETELAAQQSLLNLMEAAGCTGDEIYGVDCGVPPPVEGGGGSGGGGDISGASGFIRPLETGTISDEYGQRPSSECGGNIACFHTGIDIANSCGTPIYPSAPGQVVWSGYDPYGGNMVVIVHNVGGQQISTTYAHLSSPAYVYPGQSVGYDTVIGSVGSTGASTGCHLHFGTSYGATGSQASRFNPRQIVSFPPLGSSFYSRY